MTKPCLPSIHETGHAEMAISRMIFCTGAPYWQFVSEMRVGQVCVPFLGWLCGRRTDLGWRALLMCCHSPAGRAGPDRPRWRSSLSHSSASLTLLGWWTVTGHHSKVVCAAFFFFCCFFSPTRQASQRRSVKHCWTPLMALNLHISWLGCTADALQWTPEGSPLSGCRSCIPYSQMLMFQRGRKGTNNVTNLPGHDLTCTTLDVFTDNWALKLRGTSLVFCFFVIEHLYLS